jgi:hypothetical protein
MRKVASGARVAACCVVLGMAASAHAAELVVATDGSDANPGSLAEPFGTITHALSVAQNGDVVQIRAGTYRLMDEGPDAIALALPDATESSFLTIEAYPGEEPVMLGSLSTAGQSWESAGGGLWRVSAAFLPRDPTGLFEADRRVEHVMKDVAGVRSHADVSALTTPGSWTKADDAGIGCSSDNAGCFIVMHPVDATDPNSQIYELSQRKLFYSTGVSYLTIRGLTLYYTQDAAFSIEGGRGQLIENNVLGHNSNGDDNAYSLFVSYGGGAVVRNNRAFDSKYWGGFSNSKGITLMDMDPADPSLVEGNEVYDIVGQGIATKSGVANLVVQRNFVHDVGLGIEPPGPRCDWTKPDCVLGDPEYYPGGGWTIRENAIVRCGQGVSMTTLPESEGGIANRIYNNVFHGNEGSGVDLRLENTGTLVANNLFLENARGMFLDHGGSGEAIPIDDFMPIFSAHHNLFFGNQSDYLFRPDWTGADGSGTSYAVDEIQAGYPQEQGSLASDPLVVDATLPDFHLQAGSPAEQAGDGALYQVAAVDIGMYPFGYAGGAGGGGGAGGSAAGGSGEAAGAAAGNGDAADEGGCGCRLPYQAGAPRSAAWLAVVMVLGARRHVRTARPRALDVNLNAAAGPVRPSASRRHSFGAAQVHARQAKDHRTPLFASPPPALPAAAPRQAGIPPAAPHLPTGPNAGNARLIVLLWNVVSRQSSPARPLCSAT